ncbi:MAG: serine hydrolase domain-containing protein [Candidatus Limnocylindrales bacterium]
MTVLIGITALGAGHARPAGGLGGPDPGRIEAGSSLAPGGASSFPATRPTGSAGSASPNGQPGGSITSATADRRQAALAARLQATLDQVRTKLAIPGASATVLLPDGSTWTGVSGFAVVASKTAVTATTAFAFASISKTFTSAIILQLIDAGRLHLTDPVVGLLPPLPITIDRRITVGMLLGHTSGLADYFLNPKIDAALRAQPSATWTTDQTLRFVGPRAALPGVAWHYANTNYLLLGLIAERLTGQSLADAIRTRLLDPSGLDATWFQAEEPARARLADGYWFRGTAATVSPIDLADGSGIAPFRSVVTAAAGAGSMAGTSGDLARWARALYSGRVLGPTGTAILLSGFVKTSGYVPGVAYGYGVQALSIAGHPSLGHSGRLLGFQSAVRHFPLDGLTIAVLTNQSRADPADIVRELLAVALPVAPACPVCDRAG